MKILFFKPCIFWFLYGIETRHTNALPNASHKENGINTDNDLTYIDAVNICLQISIQYSVDKCVAGKKWPYENMFLKHSMFINQCCCL